MVSRGFVYSFADRFQLQFASEMHMSIPVEEGRIEGSSNCLFAKVIDAFNSRFGIYKYMMIFPARLWILKNTRGFDMIVLISI
jgi:hypothetical protein